MSADAAPAATQIINEAPTVIKEAKAGYKTTEFWVAIATTVLAQVGALHLPGKYGDTIATVSAVGLYILSRGFAKAGVPTVSKL